jgi:hypothetical protein
VHQGERQLSGTIVKTITAETLLTISLAAAAMPAAGREPVDARVVPPTARAPSDVVIEALIEPDAHNRYVEFVIDSGAFFASSRADLDGDRAPRKKEVTFRRLPAGNYQVRVTLVGTDGRRRTAVRYVSLW